MICQYKSLALFIMISLHSSLLWADVGVIKPQKDTVYYALLEGLKLLAVGDIDGWINQYCDGIRLCSNSSEINLIRQHKAELQKKVATRCLKNGGEAIHVDRIVGNPEIDIAVKIYLVCEENDPPRFYSLRRTVDYWFFISL